MDKPPIVAPTSKTNWWLFGGALAVIVVVATLFLFNPSQNAFYPRCWFKLSTGLDCPGCGGLRATHQLLHGNVHEAFRFNPLFVLMLPLLLLLGLNSVWTAFRGRKLINIKFPAASLWIAAVVLLAFTIVRNVPAKF